MTTELRATTVVPPGDQVPTRTVGSGGPIIGVTDLSASMAVTNPSGVSAPTHPDQVGLTAIGRDRDTYSWPNVEANTVTLDSSVNGTVIEDTKFEKAVQLDGVDGVTFRRCWFQGNTLYGIRRLNAGDALNVTIEDSDLGAHGAGKNIDQGTFWFLEGESTVQRCLIYNCEDGAKLGSGTTHVIDSWIQCVRPDSDAHADTLQFNSNVHGRLFVVRCTLEARSWQDENLNRLYAQEELTGITVTREHAGNASLEAGPCRPDIACDPVPSEDSVFYSIVDSIVTGCNYVMTASDCHGEFLRNTIIRGSANPGTDLGIRNSKNINRPATGPNVSVFHDNGEVYTGGKVNPSGESDPGPIHLLGLG